MQTVYVLIAIVAYLGLLMLISYLTSRKGADNEAFFRANRSSKWYIVAFGMIGTSISGVTFISVPGWVGSIDMTYMQMVMGFFAGYLVIANILLPLYYRLNLTTIYGYLDKRFGSNSYKTGAWFFLLSKILAAAVQLYLVAFILQTLLFNKLGIPFIATVVGIVLIIWLYSFKGGIKTIIWTDWLQTLFFITSLILILWQLASQMDLDFRGVVATVRESPHSRIFEFESWTSTQNFFKQFFSGMFITIVMTGLDQDKMQKNLTCKNLKEARKNVITYGFAFIPINLLFLSLGVILLQFVQINNIVLPEVADNILPMLVSEYMGPAVLGIFIVGIVAAAFSSADSALASLTTSFCVDILDMKNDNGSLELKKKNTRIRRVTHIAISIVFVAVTMVIYAIGSDSIIDVIYRLASYTYGPLLGLYIAGLYTKLNPTDKYVPYIAIAAPILCYVLEVVMISVYNYQMGYEMLLINGALTVFGLWMISLRNKNVVSSSITS